jgi:uncharacterized protein YsxB (DUF464 family)
MDLAVDESGLLISCRVKGHAGAGPKNQDIVCAAVSVLTRTAVRALSRREGITLDGGAPERGLFWMETGYSGGGRDFLSGAGAFLIEGLRSLSEEYPDYCVLHIHTERRN